MKSKNAYTKSKRALRHRLSALQEVAVELLKQRDPKKLLELIVLKATKLMIADSASIFLKDEKKGQLKFEITINNTLDFDFKNLKLSLKEDSLASYCFNHCVPLRINDVYLIPEDSPYKFDSTIDKKTGYLTKSILVYPLYSSHNDLLGVIQVVNHKDHLKEPWPIQDAMSRNKMPDFAQEDEDLLKSFASLASAALENTNLYKDIENLLEGFVHASVQAIETRDLATCGHSERVAILAVDLAEKISRDNSHALKQTNFTDQELKELRYASLLHDFGKIGVKESVLLKEEKLQNSQKDQIEFRIKEISHLGEVAFLRGLLGRLHQEGRPPNEIDMKRVDQEVAQFRRQMQHHWQEVLRLNATTILDKDCSKVLEQLKQVKFKFFDSQTELHLLSDEDIDFLSIRRGSLSESERDQINKHVTYTYHFLKQIPWGKEFSNITEIAYTHHEYLNGTGYPRGLVSAEIPAQAKIMTVVDIFDALVAWDRPYKKAVSFEKAIEILDMECKDGKLDAQFLNVFKQGKCYENSNFLKIMNNSNINRKKKAA